MNVPLLLLLLLFSENFGEKKNFKKIKLDTLAHA
jgi:hypothetical protein